MCLRNKKLKERNESRSEIFTLGTSIECVPVHILVEDTAMTGIKAFQSMKQGQLTKQGLTGHTKQIKLVQTGGIDQVELAVFTFGVTTNK